jgi:Na+-translocating ferredoxin:NAD+ oxidoreductase RnfG subunit
MRHLQSASGDAANFFCDMNKSKRVWIAVCVFPLLCANALAERYLTIVEAQKICFPKADQFESRSVELNKEQIKSLEKNSGSKMVGKTVSYEAAYQGTNFLGVVVTDRVLGKHELIDYVVAVSPEGKALQIEILEYREHYGGQIRESKWRNQFKGKTASAPLKLNEDIYNISGATISCRHVTEGVKRVLATYEIFIHPHLASGQLPNSATKR